MLASSNSASSPGRALSTFLLYVELGSDKAVAAALGINERSVRKRIRLLRDQLGARSRPHLAVTLMREGLL